MANCYLCAAKIRDGEGYRRDVVTGRSTRIYFTRHGGTSYSQSQGLRTLCAPCAKSLDRSREGAGLRQIFSALVMLASAAITLGVSSGGSVRDHSAASGLVYFFFLLGGPGWLLLIVLDRMHAQNVRLQEAGDTSDYTAGAYHAVQQSPVPAAGVTVTDSAPRSVQSILNVQERLSKMGVSLAGCCDLANSPDRGPKVRLFIEALIPFEPEISTVRWEQLVFEKLLRRFVNECAVLLSTILNASSELVDQDKAIEVENAMERLLSMFPNQEEAPVAYLGRAVSTLKAACLIVDALPPE